MGDLCDYEKQRLQRIQDNQKFLLSLGLDKKLEIPQVKREPTKRSKASNNEDEDFVPRRSNRGKVDTSQLASLEDDTTVPGEEGYDSDQFIEDDNKKRKKKVPRELKGRRNHLGRRVYGGRVYDSENGTTCHQCRQKTIEPKVTCTNVFEFSDGETELCNVMLDENCLTNRYGQTIEAALASGEWKCPKCLGICNCSFCRRKKGLAPTGILVMAARAAGYNCVDEYLRSGKVPKNQSLEEWDDEAAAAKPRRKRAKIAKKDDNDSNSEDSAVESISKNRPKRTTKTKSYKEEDEDEEAEDEQEPEAQEEKEETNKVESIENAKADDIVVQEEKGNEEQQKRVKRVSNETKRVAVKPETEQERKEKEEGDKKRKEEGYSEDEYEVEKILKRKKTRGGKELFFVHWKGYDDSYNTWEPRDNLFCNELLEEFLKAEEKNQKPKKRATNNKTNESKSKETTSPATEEQPKATTEQVTVKEEKQEESKAKRNNTKEPGAKKEKRDGILAYFHKVETM